MLPSWMRRAGPNEAPEARDDVSDIGSVIHIVEHGDCVDMPTPGSSKDSNSNEDLDKKETGVVGCHIAGRFWCLFDLAFGLSV